MRDSDQELRIPDIDHNNKMDIIQNEIVNKSWKMKWREEINEPDFVCNQ